SFLYFRFSAQVNHFVLCLTSSVILNLWHFYKHSRIPSIFESCSIRDHTSEIFQLRTAGVGPQAISPMFLFILQLDKNFLNSLFADDITLNPDTAHPNLSISEDKKKFIHEAQPQKVPSTPDRFDSTVCMLGSEGFSSGKHYWEVDVRSSNDWDLGVARKSIQRKGKLSLSPKEGFWALGCSGRDYWARTDPWTRVMVQKKPKKIGVYLSYQDSQVTFFSLQGSCTSDPFPVPLRAPTLTPLALTYLRMESHESLTLRWGSDYSNFAIPSNYHPSVHS
uniref:B30.2/SPRY domain-containing protein n=1 Tax=Gopherus evgoodei TaxID=1825980 RepID=A0A8C4YF49_9SAUR